MGGTRTTAVIAAAGASARVVAMSAREIERGRARALANYPALYFSQENKQKECEKMQAFRR